ENYEPIVEIALAAGVKRVIPHIYSSIIDAASGDTRPQDVKTLLAMTKKLVG
ncbi:KDGP aldolase, partial [Serratia marcescens]